MFKAKLSCIKMDFMLPLSLLYQSEHGKSCDMFAICGSQNRAPWQQVSSHTLTITSSAVSQDEWKRIASVSSFNIACLAFHRGLYTN